MNGGDTCGDPNCPSAAEVERLREALDDWFGKDGWRVDDGPEGPFIVEDGR